MTLPGLEVADRLALQELYARYAHAFDGGRAEEVAALFTDDGALQRTGAEPVRGRAALSALVQRAHELSSGARQHLVTGIILEAESEGVARGTAYVTVLSAVAGTVRVSTSGRYVDTFRREDGRWLIQERIFVPLLEAAPGGAVPLAGDPAPSDGVRRV